VESQCHCTLPATCQCLHAVGLLTDVWFRATCEIRRRSRPVGQTSMALMQNPAPCLLPGNPRPDRACHVKVGVWSCWSLLEIYKARHAVANGEMIHSQIRSPTKLCILHFMNHSKTYTEITHPEENTSHQSIILAYHPCYECQHVVVKQIYRVQAVVSSTSTSMFT
jgi:hypothetical protein